MKIENDTSDCAVLFLRSFRVQNWCKFGAKTYRTMQKLCNDMRRKRHKIAQNERFSTIFRGINASRKTPRDNYSFGIISIYKKLCITQGFLCCRAVPWCRRLPLRIFSAGASPRPTRAVKFVKNPAVLFTFHRFYGII